MRCLWARGQFIKGFVDKRLVLRLVILAGAAGAAFDLFKVDWTEKIEDAMPQRKQIRASRASFRGGEMAEQLFHYSSRPRMTRHKVHTLGGSQISNIRPIRVVSGISVPRENKAALLPALSSDSRTCAQAPKNCLQPKCAGNLPSCVGRMASNKSLTLGREVGKGISRVSASFHATSSSRRKPASHMNGTRSIRRSLELVAPRHKKGQNDSVRDVCPARPCLTTLFL